MSSAIAERRGCKEFFSRRRRLDHRQLEDFDSRRHRDECNDFEKNFDVQFSTVLEKAARGFPSIAIDPDVLSGTPRISGTRIPVYMVVDAVEYHGSISGALTSYGNLTTEQVKDALSFAAAVLEHSVEHESEATPR